MTRYQYSGGIFFLWLAMMSIASASSMEAQSCNFTRSLYKGVQSGLDVLCLQEYLNSTEYKVSYSGVGSVGQETTIYGDKTKQAVLAWQRANNVPGANGVFGPASRATYARLQKDNPIINNKPNGTHISSNSTATSTLEEQTKKLVQEAIIEVQDTQELLDDSLQDREVRSTFDDAVQAMLGSFSSYLNGDYIKTMSQTSNAIVYTKTTQNILETKQDEKRTTRKEIEETEERLEDIRDEIDDAHNDGYIVRRAYHRLEDAEEVFEDAQDAYRDFDYSKAIRFLREAEDLADDAEDAIEELDEEERAEMKIDEADNLIDEVDDEIYTSKEAKENINEAKSLLYDAIRKLRDAQDALDRTDYKDAFSLGEEAFQLAEDAEQEL